MAGGSPRLADSMTRPVLVPAGNKAEEPPLLRRKTLTKATRVEEEVSLEKERKKKTKKKKKKKKVAGVSVEESKQSSQRPLLLRSDLSPNASCSSDCSADSFRSGTASTPRVGGLAVRPKKHLEANLVGGGGDLSEITRDKRRRCPWVTPKTDPCYTAFHDEEWGVPVHDDKKLFELLVLSGALSELTWPEILSKRNLFREVFMEFDPVAVSKLNEKKITAQRSTASSLVSEAKLRSIIENACQILKAGSLFKSCMWSSRQLCYELNVELLGCISDDKKE